ncbi:uncharacterized protein LOC128963531 [Oppia nitens]|uniref:uncharacterized protein LOC128963531 n=1 Tax=Oppia nitens TaxID=1686743 RepID=UPI0023DB78EB|nr:uncharacterized protein LOC128963531 [Oppia nitens]
MRLVFLPLVFVIINYLPFISSTLKSSNIGLTQLLTVKATFNTCFKCNVDSHVSMILDSTSVDSIDMTCNGFVYNQMSYYYKVFIDNNPQLLTINQLHSFSAFLNGNMVSVWNGFISNGTCAGDYIYSVVFSKAENQNGCNGDQGVRQLSVIWDMFQIIGKCDSLCYGKGFTTLRPAISNKGIVEYKDIYSDNQYFS